MSERNTHGTASAVTPTEQLESGGGGNLRSAAGTPATSKTPASKPGAVAGSSCILVVMSILCLTLGFAVLVVPATWSDEATLSAYSPNHTCPAITPSTAPQSTLPLGTRDAYVRAWWRYTNATLYRPEGVGAGCEPLRFPATGPYKGVAVLWHGFSSCPQEMSMLAPPLAAHGYDVLLPLMPGHGNEVAYQPDSTYWLWGWLMLGISTVGLCIVICVGCVPVCAKCPCCKEDKCRKACASISAAVFGALLLTSIASIIVTVTGDSVVCAGYDGAGCGGYAERTTNLPSDAAAYRAAAAEMNAIVALAPGDKVLVGLSGHVLVGLSGGGGLALYAGQATDGVAAALYARQLLLAPYIELVAVGGILNLLIGLGLGNVKVDYGASCRTRRALGKAGYCNIALKTISAMRDVGQQSSDSYVLPRGTHVQVVSVADDPTVVNSKIDELSARLASQSAHVTASSSSSCVLNHVQTAHSPLSIWNYLHLPGPPLPMDWVPELVCDVVDFLANGVPLPTSNGTQACRPDCGRGNCDFECRSSDSFLTCPTPP